MISDKIRWKNYESPNAIHRLFLDNIVIRRSCRRQHQHWESSTDKLFDSDNAKEGNNGEQRVRRKRVGKY
jgi:hypothetical protein